VELEQQWGKKKVCLSKRQDTPSLPKKWLLMTILKMLMATSTNTEVSLPAVQQGLCYSGTITLVLIKCIS